MKRSPKKTPRPPRSNGIGPKIVFYQQPSRLARIAYYERRAAQRLPLTTGRRID